MPYGKRMLFDSMRSLASGSISGTYAAVGGVLQFPMRIIHVTNLTDVTLTYSMDGTNDHFVLPSMCFLLLDISSDRAKEDAFFLAEGEILYVKGSPTTGTTYFSSIYGKGD